MRIRPWPMTAVLASIIGLVVCTNQAVAADSQRAMKWQFTVPITLTSGETIDGQNGTKFELEDDLGWGFGFGYHLNERLMFGADFTWINASYNAHVTTDFDSDGIADDSIDASGTLDAGSLQFVGQYNFMTRTFTPFVRGSFGWTWIDSNIAAGPPVGGCWWDPWYGYICSSSQPTYGDTAFSYGAAVGVRAELSQGGFFLEGSYNMLWIDLDQADTSSFDGFRITMGWSR